MEEQNNNQVENKSFAYQLGQVIAGMTAACIGALVIAITVKLIMWIL